jgi:glutathione S-transferase
MKLFYTPSACSLATNIALREAGVAFDLEKVDLRTKRTETGRDFTSVNPKGYVPALELDDGEILTEGVAILPYVADLRGAAGTIARHRIAEWLGYIATELHKPFGALFDSSASEAAKQAAREKILRRIGFVDAHLAQSEWLHGASFTVADAYLFTVTRWAAFVSLDISGFASLARFMARAYERPAVKAALEAEARGDKRADVLVAA